MWCITLVNRISFLLCHTRKRFIFGVTDASVYLKLYRTYVMPHVEYCCIIWMPRYAKDRALVERMQERFLRRVELRCNFPRRSLELLSVAERMELMDVSYLRQVIRNERRFDEMFDLSASSSRRGFVSRAKEPSKSTKISHMYPWRVSSKING